MIIKDLTNEAESIIDDQEKTTQLLIVTNHKAFRERHLLKKIWQKLTLFISLVSDWLKGEYKYISPKALIGILVGLLYFVNPFDSIMDSIPVIGLLDDIALISFIYDAFKSDLVKYEIWKLAQNKPEITIEV